MYSYIFIPIYVYVCDYIYRDTYTPDKDLYPEYILKTPLISHSEKRPITQFL